MRERSAGRWYIDNGVAEARTSDFNRIKPAGYLLILKKTLFKRYIFLQPITKTQINKMY